MESVKFLTLLAFILDNLIWPLVTILYPLYASIRAIENNSLADNRKCLTYWVTCGLIMFFEFISARLIEWLPFWFYIKLVVTLMLVARHFEGAVYAYDHFVRPCFSVNPQMFGHWLNIKRSEFSVSSSDNFVLLAKKFVQENGSEALEKVIDKVNSVEQKLAIAENKSVTYVKNKEGNPLVIKLESSVIDTGHETTVTTENRATLEANAARASEHPQSSVPNKAQKEWTCALRQVCTPSEVVLQNHLQGKKHQANAEKIKVSDHAHTNYDTVEASKNEPTREVGVTGGGGELPGLSSLDDTEKDRSHPLRRVHSSGDASLLDHIQGEEHKAEEMELSEKHVAACNKTGPNFETKEGESMSSETNGRKVSNMAGAKSGSCESPGSSTPENIQKNWSCALCQIFAPNKIALQDHFRGRKHKTKQMEHLAKVTAANNKNRSSLVKPKVTQKRSVSASISNPEYVKTYEEKKIGDTGTGHQRISLSELWCEKCKLQCNSLSMLTDHRGGRRHRSSNYAEDH